MQIVEPSVRILAETPDMEKLIEFALRHCYKSEDRITDDSYKRMIENAIAKGHTSPLEHSSISVELITNRGVLAELTRHRITSPSVESTRYCNYSPDKKGLKICRPVWLDKDVADRLGKSVWESDSPHYMDIVMEWYSAMLDSERHYNTLLNLGVSTEFARGVLPMDLAVSMVMTTNVREWRHILSLRHDARFAHPDIVHIMNMILEKFNSEHPVLFPLEDFPDGDYSFKLEGFKSDIA